MLPVLGQIPHLWKKKEVPERLGEWVSHVSTFIFIILEKEFA